MIPWKLLTFLVCLILGTLRVHGEKSQLFQGIAHITVGVVFGLGITRRWYYLVLGVLLTTLEIICFVAMKPQTG